jgi:hypothetical protein
MFGFPQQPQLGTIKISEGYWFKSSKFEIEPGEDAEINPRIYGRRLAIWLKERLEQSGYAVEEIIYEDWAGASCVNVIRSCFGQHVGSSHSETR